jgi:hypothetical protein
MEETWKIHSSITVQFTHFIAVALPKGGQNIITALQVYSKINSPRKYLPSYFCSFLHNLEFDIRTTHFAFVTLLIHTYILFLKLFCKYSRTDLPPSMPCTSHTLLDGANAWSMFLDFKTIWSALHPTITTTAVTTLRGDHLASWKTALKLLPVKKSLKLISSSFLEKAGLKGY